jgi:hypothetical protein
VREVANLDVTAILNTEFDLSKDALFQIHFSSNKLMVLASHAIADLNSVHVLLRDASKIYSGAVPVAPRFNYLTASGWNHRPGEREKSYWSQALQDVPKCCEMADLLPSDTLYQGISVVDSYGRPIVRPLRRLMEKYSVTRHQLVCAAVAQTLQWLNQCDDIVLGCPYENRHSEVARESVGLFLDRLPLRMKTSKTATTAELLRAARDITQGALAHAIPFHELMGLLGVSPTLEHHPIFQTMVTFHLQGSTEECLQVPGCTIQREQCHPPGAKFLLMFEWTELSTEDWMLRIEYDNTRIQDRTMAVIRAAMRLVLAGLAAEMDRSTIHATLDLQFKKSNAASPPPGVQDKIVDTIRHEMALCLGVDVARLPCTLSFFDAGANSMAAFRLHRRLKQIGLDTSLRTIFDFPTAKDLSGAFIAK